MCIFLIVLKTFKEKSLYLLQKSEMYFYNLQLKMHILDSFFIDKSLYVLQKSGMYVDGLYFKKIQKKRAKRYFFVARRKRRAVGCKAHLWAESEPATPSENTRQAAKNTGQAAKTLGRSLKKNRACRPS